MVKTHNLNLLFVCSRNRWRSPTAEAIYRRYPGVDARSAGTSPHARRAVTIGDLRWADLVLAMERRHLQRLLADFPEAMREQRVHVLEIEDDYRFMDPELVQAIREAVDPILEAMD